MVANLLPSGLARPGRLCNTTGAKGGQQLGLAASLAHGSQESLNLLFLVVHEVAIHR